MASLISKITEYYLGHKYYAVILNRRRERFVDLSCFIFYTRSEAEQYMLDRQLNDLTFQPLELVSFRSRKKYVISYNDDLHMRQTICPVPSDLPKVILPYEADSCNKPKPYPEEDE